MYAHSLLVVVRAMNNNCNLSPSKVGILSSGSFAERLYFKLLLLLLCPNI